MRLWETKKKQYQVYYKDPSNNYNELNKVY